MFTANKDKATPWFTEGQAPFYPGFTMFLVVRNSNLGNGGLYGTEKHGIVLTEILKWHLVTHQMPF